MQEFRVYSQPFGRRRTKVKKMGGALCSAVVVAMCWCASSVVAEKSRSDVVAASGNSSSSSSLAAAVSKTFGSKVSTDFPSSANVITTNFASLKNTTFKIGASKKYYMKYASSTTTTTTTAGTTSTTAAATSSSGTTPAAIVSSSTSATKRPTTTTTTLRTTAKPAITKTTPASTVTTSRLPPPPPPTPLGPPPTAAPTSPPKKVEKLSKSQNGTSASSVLPEAQPLIQEMDVFPIPDQIAQGSDHFMNVVAPPRRTSGNGATAQHRSDGGQGFMPPHAASGHFPQSFEKFGVQDSLLYKNNEVVPQSSTGPGPSGAFGGGSNVNFGPGGGPPQSSNYGGTPQPHRLATTFQHSGGFTGGSNSFNNNNNNNNRNRHSAPPQPTSGGAYQFPSVVDTNGFHHANSFPGSSSFGGTSHGHNYHPHSPAKTGNPNVQSFSPYSTLVQNKDLYQSQNGGPPPPPPSYSSHPHSSPQSPSYHAGSNHGGGFGFPSSAPSVPNKFPTTTNSGSPFGPPNNWQPSAPSHPGPVYPGHGGPTKRNDRLGTEMKYKGKQNKFNPSSPIHFSNNDGNNYGPGPANNFGPPVGPPTSSPQNGPGFLGSFDAPDMPPTIGEPPTHQNHAPENTDEDFGPAPPGPTPPVAPVLRPQGFNSQPQHYPPGRQGGSFNTYDSSSSAALSGVDGGQSQDIQENAPNQEPSLPLRGPPLNEFNTQHVPPRHAPPHSEGPLQHHPSGGKNKRPNFDTLSNIEHGFGDFNGFRGSNIPHSESSQTSSGQEDTDGDGYNNFVGGPEPPRVPKKMKEHNFNAPQQFPRPPPNNFDGPRHGSFHNAPIQGPVHHPGSAMPPPDFKNFPGGRGPPKHGPQHNSFNDGFAGPPGHSHDAPTLPRPHGFEGFSGSGGRSHTTPGQFNTGLPGGNSLPDFNGFGTKQNQAGSLENSGSGSAESGGGSEAPGEIESEPQQSSRGESGDLSDEQPQALPQVGFGPGGIGPGGHGPHFAGNPPVRFGGPPSDEGPPPRHLQDHSPGFGGFPIQGGNVGPSSPGPGQFSPGGDGISGHQNSVSSHNKQPVFRGFGGPSHSAPIAPQHSSGGPSPAFGPFYIDPNQVEPQTPQQHPEQGTPDFGNFPNRPNPSGPVPTQQSSRRPNPGFGPFYGDPNQVGQQAPRHNAGQSAPQDFNGPSYPSSGPPQQTSPPLGFNDFTSSDQPGHAQHSQNRPPKNFGKSQQHSPQHGFGGPQQYQGLDSPSHDFNVPPPKSHGPPSSDYVPLQQGPTQHGFSSPTPQPQGHPFQGFDAPELPIYSQDIQDPLDKDVGGPSNEDIPPGPPSHLLHQTPDPSFNEIDGPTADEGPVIPIQPQHHNSQNHYGQSGSLDFERNPHGHNTHGSPDYSTQSTPQSSPPGFQEFGNFPGKHAHLILKPDEAPQGNSAVVGQNSFGGSPMNHAPEGHSPQVVNLQGPPQVVTFQDPPQVGFQETDTDTSASNSIEFAIPGFSGGPGLHGFGPGDDSYSHGQSGGHLGSLHNPVDDLEKHHPGLGPPDSALVNVPGAGFVGGSPAESPQGGGGYGLGPGGPSGVPQGGYIGDASPFGPGGLIEHSQGAPNGGGSPFGPGPGGPIENSQGGPNGGGSPFGSGPGGPIENSQGGPISGGFAFGPGPGGPIENSQGGPIGGGPSFGPGAGGPAVGGPQFGPGGPFNNPQSGSTFGPGPIGVGPNGPGPGPIHHPGGEGHQPDHHHDDHHQDHHHGPIGHHPGGHHHKPVFPIGFKKVVLNPLKLLGGLKKPIIGPVKVFGGIKPIHGKLKTFGSHGNHLGPVNGFGGGFNNPIGPVNGFGGGFNNAGGPGGGLVKNPVAAVPLKAISGLKHAVGGIKHAVAIPVKGIVSGIKKPIVGPVKGVGIGIGHGGGPLKGFGLLKGILDGKGKFPLDHKVAKIIKVIFDIGFKIVSFYAKLSIPKDHYLRVISFAGVYLLLGWLFKDSDHLLFPKCEKWGWNGPEEFTFHAPARFVPAVPVDQEMQREFLELFRGVEGCLDEKVAEDKKKKKKKKKEKEKKKRNKDKNRGKDKDKSNSSSEEDEEEDDKGDDSGENDYSMEIGFINDMCPRGQFFYSMSPYHIEAWQTLSRMFVAQETPADVLQLARGLLHDHSVNPKVWYLGLAAASVERPDMTGFTLAHPLDAFPDMYVPAHLIEGEMQRYRGLLPRVKRSLLQKINITSTSKYTKVLNRRGMSLAMLENTTATTTTEIPTTVMQDKVFSSRLGIPGNSSDDRNNEISKKSRNSIQRRKGDTAEDDEESDEDDEIDEDDGSDSEEKEGRKKKKKHPLGYGHGYIGDGYGGFNRQNGNNGIGGGGNGFGGGSGNGGNRFGGNNGGGGNFGGLFGNRNKGKDKDKSKEKGKKGKGKKKKDKKKCIIVDGSVGLDNGIENKLWYWREDLMLNQHHAYWHQLYPVNASIHGDRRAEIFFFMHRNFLARYNAERLSNGFARTLELGLYPGAIIDEGYDSHLKDFNSDSYWAPRAHNTPLADILHADDPDYARDIIISDVIALYNSFVKGIKLGKLLTADGKFLPIRFHEGINPLANTIEATNISVNPLYYDAFGLHNLGHLLVALAADPDWSKKLPSGIMGEAAVSMRDPAFYTYHTILDNLFEKFKRTLPPYKPYGGVWPLQWHGVEITDVKLVSHSGGDANHLTTFYIKHKFELQPGVDRSIQKGVEKANICAVHLDHAPFQFQISIDRKKCAKSKSGQGTVRLFMAPRYDEEGHRLSLQEQRRLMFQLDAFQVELKVGRNIITRNSRDNSLTRPWTKSLSEFLRGPDPSGAAEYCGCGWPRHLFIPKGNTKGMAFDLFAMVTNFDEDFVANHPVDMEMPERCNSPYIFCGLPRRRYPDSRPMGYPFDRPPYLVPAKACGHGPALDPKNLVCKLAGKIFQRPVSTLEEYVSGATNMAMTVFEIKHIPKVVGKHHG